MEEPKWITLIFTACQPCYCPLMIAVMGLFVVVMVGDKGKTRGAARFCDVTYLITAHVQMWSHVTMIAYHGPHAHRPAHTCTLHVLILKHQVYHIINTYTTILMRCLRRRCAVTAFGGDSTQNYINYNERLIIIE